MKKSLQHYFIICLSLFSLTFIAGWCDKKDPAPKPSAFFDYYPSKNLVAPVKIYFTNKSQNATSYVWTNESGQTTTSKDASISFNSGGAYTITLEAKGEGGTDTYSETIYVDDPPVATTKPSAGFTYSPSSNLVAPATVSFTNTSTNANSYKWDFGDGTTSTLTNPSKQYTNDGSYTVKLTATGSGGSAETSQNLVVGKAATVDPVGKAVFWATGAWDYVEIETESVIYHKQAGDAGYVSFSGGRIEKLFTSAPACGATDAYTTERPAKTYTYKATAYKSGSIKIAERSGTYTVVANTCTAIKIDFPAAATGQAVFWTSKSSGWSSIDVTIGGTAAGAITTYYSSAPNCGSSLTVTRPPGTYTYTAKSNTGVTWNGNITISADQCSRMQLNFPETSASNCDWNKYTNSASLTVETKWGGCGADGLSVKITNKTNIKLNCYFCMEGKDGKWDCGASTINAGSYHTSWSCKNTGEVKVWAIDNDAFNKNNCSYPKP